MENGLEMTDNGPDSSSTPNKQQKKNLLRIFVSVQRLSLIPFKAYLTTSDFNYMSEMRTGVMLSSK